MLHERQPLFAVQAKTELEVGDLTLRSLRARDATQVLQTIQANRSFLEQHTPDIIMATPDEECLQIQIDNYILVAKKKLLVHYGIFHGPEHIGGVRLQIARQNNIAEIGIWLAEKHSGRGHGKGVISALAEYGLNELGIDHVYAQVRSNNTRSINMMRKLGWESSFIRDITLFGRSRTP